MIEYKKEIQLFKALSHPTRIAILELLRNGEQCVCHLEASLGLRQAYISQQLGVLRKAGLLAKRRDGWNIYYRVLNKEVFAVLDSVYQMTGTPKIEQTITPATCTCPHCESEDAQMLVIPEDILS